MTDDKTIAIYDEKAQEYADLVGTDAPDANLQGFIDLIPAGGKVLDLGCGPATASAHMRAAGLVPDPVDASAGMVETANRLHDIGARIGTFDDIAGTAIYDGVWANFCLLHAAREDLPRHFLAIAKALKPCGVFHIGMKTGDGARRDRIDRFYTYVTVPELSDLITDAGLNVIYTQTGEDKGLDGTIAPFVVMRAVKHG